MSKLNGSLLLLVCAMLTPSCATSRAAPNGDYFKKTDSYIGQAITVDGYLYFEEDNRNIFPEPYSRALFTDGNCIPIAIRSSNGDMVDAAESVNGTKVRVSGTVEVVMTDTLVNNSFCKTVGVRPTSIRPVHK